MTDRTTIEITIAKHHRDRVIELLGDEYIGEESNESATGSGLVLEHQFFHDVVPDTDFLAPLKKHCIPYTLTIHGNLYFDHEFEHFRVDETGKGNVVECKANIPVEVLLEARAGGLASIDNLLSEYQTISWDEQLAIIDRLDA